MYLYFFATLITFLSFVVTKIFLCVLIFVQLEMYIQLIFLFIMVVFLFTIPFDPDLAGIIAINFIYLFH